MSAPPITPAERRRRRSTSLLLPKAGGSAFTREPNRQHPRVALYVRLSLTQDASVSIARQRATLEAYVAELGGVYDASTDYFEDDDISAKGTVYRPAAERLLQAVAAGDYDGVMVWEFARFMRTVRETHIACGLMREHAVELYSFEERHLTLYGPGRIALEFAADQAEKELQKISARVAAARAFLSQYGPAPAHAPFGMVKVAVPSPIEGRTAPLNRLAPDEEPRAYLGGHSPAGLMREAARQVAAGGSVRSVALAWNMAGYTTASGAEWTASHTSQLLRNPLLAGFSVHRGQVVTDADGHPRLFHDPVLDAATWADLSSIVAGRVVRPRSTVDSPLRGLLRCGRCGAGMSRSGRGTSRVYRCWRAQHGGCAGNTITATKTEALIVEPALALLGDPERLAELHAGADPRAIAEREQREEAAHRLRSALDRIERSRAMGEYDDADGERRYTRVKESLVGELEALMAAARRTRPRRQHPALVPADGVSVAQAFEDASPALRLTVLSEVIEHIVIRPAPERSTGTGRPTYRPERVAITWQQGDL
jgi:DNA invertase Pin-like site-specific DNA recombinase